MSKEDKGGYRSESNLKVLTERMIEKNAALLQKGLPPYPKVSWEVVKQQYRARFSDFGEESFFNSEEDGFLTLGLLQGGYNPRGNFIEKMIFDQNGRCIQSFNTVGHTTEEYSYDNSGRLISITHDNSDYGYDKTLEYSGGQLSQIKTQFRGTKYYANNPENWGGLLSQSK